MKKYIIPLTEKQEVLNMSIICDGTGQQNNPTPGNGVGGDSGPLGAPIRVF